jgi:hypothetical protein
MPVFSSYYCCDILVCFVLHEQRNHDQHKTLVNEFYTHFQSVHIPSLRLVVISSSYSALSITSFWISTLADTDTLYTFKMNDL